MRSRKSIKNQIRKVILVPLLAIFLVVASVGTILHSSATVAAQSDDIVISEIMFDPDGADAGNEWIDLCNKGTLVSNVNGWTVSDRTGAIAATLPNWDFPNGTILTIYFGIGTDDSDFSDGSGSFYTQSVVEVFDNTEDEVALYDSIPSATSIVDFVAYCFDGPYNPGVAHGYAVSAGIWDAGDYFPEYPPDTHMRPKIAWPGESIGRDQYCTDTNQPADWDVNGGEDASGPTPGAPNVHMLDLFFQPPIAPQPIKEWTFMAYMDADNDLESAIFGDLDEMEQVGSDENINIVFQFDGIKNVREVTISDSVRTPVPNTRGNTFRGYLESEPVRDDKLVHGYPAPDGVYNMGELNMGAPATLTDFVQWARSWFPAEKYALIILNHGGGWKGVAWDDTNAEDGLYMGELKDALSPVPKLDILGFDACLMAMIEVGYQMRNNADIMVASEESIANPGWPYDTILADLRGNSSWTGTQFAERMVYHYHDFYTNSDNPDECHTLSAINLGADFLQLVYRVDFFAYEMLGDHSQDEWGLEDYDFRFTVHYNPSDNVEINLRHALSITEHYEDANFKDLYDLMENIEAEDSIPPEYKAQAVPIMNLLEKGAGVVIAEEHGTEHEPSHGLSIYFPQAGTKNNNVAVCTSSRPTLENPFDNPWPSCIDTSTLLATYALDRTIEWGDVPYSGQEPHPLPETPNFDFREYRWDEFLHRYYKPVADAGEDQYVTCNPGQDWVVITLNGCGSSDSDLPAPPYQLERYIWDLDATVNSDSTDCDRDGKPEEPDDDSTINTTECIVTTTLPCETRIIKLTVWDDHTTEQDTRTNYQLTERVSHSNHWKTDQDSCIITVIAGNVTYCGDGIVQPPLEECDPKADPIGCEEGEVCCEPGWDWCTPCHCYKAIITPVFPNWYAMMAAVVAAGGLGYLTSRRLLKRA